MPRRPPTSLLFPYTTLFRSYVRLGQVRFLKRRSHLVFLSRLEARPIVPEIVQVEAIDRKSTRLNSSHRCISYAVFCLKKKKLKILTTQKPTTTHMLNTSLIK